MNPKRVVSGFSAETLKDVFVARMNPVVPVPASFGQARLNYNQTLAAAIPDRTTDQTAERIFSEPFNEEEMEEAKEHLREHLQQAQKAMTDRATPTSVTWRMMFYANSSTGASETTMRSKGSSHAAGLTTSSFLFGAVESLYHGQLSTTPKALPEHRHLSRPTAWQGRRQNCVPRAGRKNGRCQKNNKHNLGTFVKKKDKPKGLREG
ncbi:hypothetical protein B0H13DRAFT_2562297 [Mycena leptocephala]|nr:hypothetical protein B0H13DRAFT_2562297 [Mycena leptocephala]